MSDPKPNDNASTVTRVYQTQRTMSVMDAPRVYKTVKEMKRAMRKGTYDISRMFHKAKNGTLYFACLESDSESED